MHPSLSLRRVAYCYWLTRPPSAHHSSRQQPYGPSKSLWTNLLAVSSLAGQIDSILEADVAVGAAALGLATLRRVYIEGNHIDDACCPRTVVVERPLLAEETLMPGADGRGLEAPISPLYRRLLCVFFALGL